MDYEFKAEEQIKCPICGESANYREFPDVVRLLQQGEKYRQMWHSLKYDMCRMEEDNWLNTIYDLEQKHFPKEETNEKG